MDENKRRYQIFLQSEHGTPIDVYLVSHDGQDQTQDEIEQSSEVQLNIVSPVASPTRSPQPHLTPKKAPLSPDTAVESSGLLKLPTPPQVDPAGKQCQFLDLCVFADYYLNNMYQSEGISDFYEEEILTSEQVEK